MNTAIIDAARLTQARAHNAGRSVSALFFDPEMKF